MNEPYSEGPGPDGDGKGSGQFTHKVYHIGRWLLIILKVGHIAMHLLVISSSFTLVKTRLNLHAVLRYEKE